MPKPRRQKNQSKSRSRTRISSRKFYGISGGDVRSRGEPRFNYSGITGGDTRSRVSPRVSYSGVENRSAKRSANRSAKRSANRSAKRSAERSAERSKRLKNLKENGAYFKDGLLYNKNGKRIDTLGRLVPE